MKRIHSSFRYFIFRYFLPTSIFFAILFAGLFFFLTKEMIAMLVFFLFLILFSIMFKNLIYYKRVDFTEIGVKINGQFYQWDKIDSIQQSFVRFIVIKLKNSEIKAMTDNEFELSETMSWSQKDTKFVKKLKEKMNQNN